MSSKSARVSAALVFVVGMMAGMPVREGRETPSLLERLERALPASVRAVLHPIPAPEGRREAPTKCGPGIDPDGKPCG
jgi:hypothetical protein